MTTTDSEEGRFFSQSELRELFKNLRISANLDFATLAKLTGVAANEFEAWEHGFSEITPEAVKSLFDLYGQLLQDTRQ